MNAYLQNLHTHTTYCDGKDTPEEMVVAAYEKGFQSIGFSTHTYCMDQPIFSQTLDEYRKEIAALKKKYADMIEVYCGLECEMRVDIDMSGYDYLIGAVHYFQIGNEFVGFDRPAQKVRTIIERYFAGDGMAYAKAYYQELSKLSEYGNFDIIGHFDLITKHCESEQFFDENSKEYQNLAIEAAEQLAGKIPYFEVNTGAMARRYRTTPYPQSFLLKELKRLGFGAIISSDCHDSKCLDCGYQEAAEILRQCGFKERFILTKDGFAPIEL